MAREMTQPRETTASMRSRRWTWVLVLAIAVGAVAMLAWRARHEPARVDSGFSITVADVQGEHADTAGLLGDALRYDVGGDRAHARALLEALQGSDKRTPWPAALLGLWAVGEGNAQAADAWLARARERAAPLHDAYINAMLRYAEAERSGAASDIIRYAGAVLDLRPDAWRMYLARAHLMYAQGMREAALAEIRRIDIHELGNRKLEAALADRASFGDVAGAQAILNRLPRMNDAAAWDYLAGRIAWSRGDSAAARAAWERAAQEAPASGRSDIGNRAHANAGLAAMLAGDNAAALDHFERARNGMADAGWFSDEIDLSLLLAQLQAVTGNTAAARVEFDRAVAASARGSDGVMRTQIALVGARLFPEREAIAVQTDPAATALLAARLAHGKGDDVTARSDLAVAQQRGVLELACADEARLLAAELGLPVAAERRLDPPYPPLSPVGARLFLRQRP